MSDKLWMEEVMKGDRGGDRKRKTCNENIEMINMEETILVRI